MFAGRNEDRKKTAGMTVLGVLEEEADNQLLRFFFMSIIPEMMSTAATTAPNATAIIVTGFAEKLFLAGSVGDCSSEGDSVADISAGRTTASSVGTDVGTGDGDCVRTGEGVGVGSGVGAGVSVGTGVGEGVGGT